MSDMSKPALLALTLLLASLSTAASAATCISGQAAETGADSAYERKRDAIEAIEEAEENASSEWGQCLGSISGQVGWPSFPSTGEIFDQIKQEVCEIAQQSIDDKIDQANSNIDSIYNQVPTEADVPVIGSVGGDAGSVSIGSSQESLSSFYEGIWQ